jgi:hypothetical protein
MALGKRFPEDFFSDCRLEKNLARNLCKILTPAQSMRQSPDVCSSFREVGTMAHQDPKESCGIDRGHAKSERKVRGKRHAAARTAAGEADPYPADLAEQFLKHLLEYEQAPCTTHFQQLERAGLDLPAPEQVSDGQLTAKLGALIAGLAQIHVFLSNTDHLSDRDLYVSLWAEGLREPVALTAGDDPFAWNLDLLGSGSARDIYLHLKYYADEEYRRDWTEQFPGEEIPAHEDPPFDRDRHLPQPTYDLQNVRGKQTKDCRRT